MSVPRCFFFQDLEGLTEVSVLLGEWTVLLRAETVLTKDPRPLYYKTPPCLFDHKIALRKAFVGPS